jgi:hypothetical protein
MKFDDLKDAITIDKAVELISQNNTQSFVWHPVRGVNGCVFEMGGRSYQGNTEIKVYVPEYEGNKILVHENGHVKHSYSIDSMFIELSTIRMPIPKGFDLIKFLRKTDIRKPLEFDTVSRKVVTYVSEYVLTDKRFK